jgi:chromosome segregation ATPase
VNSDTAPSAAEALAELAQRRAAAQAKVDHLEAEQRAASEAREAARAALIEFERKGGRPAERAKLEHALADAEARASERWPERIEGARQAVRDAHQQVQHFTGKHLDELVKGLERDGEVAAASVNAAAAALVAAFQERERIAGEISTLVSSVARIHPADVAYSRAEQVVRAASELIDQGGEVAPVLRRDPRQPRSGLLPEAEAASAV